MNHVPPISAGQILTGSLFNEPIRVETVLSALYPKRSEEKRLLEAMRLAVPR